MSLPLPELRRGAAPLVEQLVRHFETAIQQGRYRPGDRLPPIREAAQRLAVTRATVQDAYRRLADAGVVSATVGRGTIVTAAGGRDGASVFSAGAHAAWEQLRGAPQSPSLPLGVEVVANLAELLPDQQQFPVAAFRDSLARVLQDRGGEVLCYGHPLGSPDLRAELARRPEEADPRCDPDEILVTSGAQQGIDLVLRTFTSPGDAVVVPVPTYHHLFGLLRAHGLELVPVAQDRSGLDLDALVAALRRPDVRLLYVMPTFHNPTGRTLSLTQRQALVEALTPTRVPVLEDEFQRELRFAGEPLPSLRHLDPRGLTVTVRTFSKGLFPAVRTGWVRAARDVLSRMAALKRFTDLETSPLLQAALVDFMAAGAFDRYVTSLRAELARRHATARQTLAQAMPKRTAWSEPEGGFAAWVEPPALDCEVLAQAAAARGVLVTPGRVFQPGGEPQRGLRLSLSRVSCEAIRAGIEVLGECAHELLERAHPARTRIFL
ncbi:MAG: PLP-dependent aminotransferase family protein [Planctomycetota bacterium]